MKVREVSGWAAMVLVIVLVATGCGGRGGAKSLDGISWDDPAGDVTQPADNSRRPEPDVTKVTARSEPGFLILRADFAVGPKECFDYTSPKNVKFGNTMIEYMLDCEHRENP